MRGREEFSGETLHTEAAETQVRSRTVKSVEHFSREEMRIRTVAIFMRIPAEKSSMAEAEN